MSDKNVLIQVTDLKKHYNKGEIKALDGCIFRVEQGRGCCHHRSKRKRKIYLA